MGGIAAQVYNSPFETAGKDMRQAFYDAGYAPPQVVFWNLRVNGKVTFQYVE